MKSLIFLIMFMSGLANAQIPETLSYQGVLTDASGTAITDGNYSLTFKLYESATGGSSIWGETQDVKVVNGVFNAILGSVNPLSNSFDRPYWLGIAIGSDPELEPRIELTASAYSLNARSIADGQVVKSVNALKDAIIITAEGGATVTTRNDSVIINAGSGGGGTGIKGVQNTNNTLDISNPNGPTATINIKDGGVGAQQIADSVITSQKIANGQVVRNIKLGPINNFTVNLTDEINLKFASSLILDAEGGPDGGFILAAKADGHSLDAADGDPIDAVFVDNNGNVGIGTTTPAQQLDITGNLQLPATAADSGDSVGIIMVDGKRFIHNFGSNNFFAGVNAGNLTMTGSANTASGRNALHFNTTGSFNTASGHQALEKNTTGRNNTASGEDALRFNTTGSDNTASGLLALEINTTGSDNTASGVSALEINTTGSANTAVGRNALDANTTGSNNTAIGRNADVTVGNLTNATAIGANAVVDASNKIRLGDNNVTIVETAGTLRSLSAQVGLLVDGKVGIGTAATNILTVLKGSATDPIADAWTTYSSRRWKTNIKTIENPLEMVQALRGVTYDWKKDGKHDIGLIAEEVGEVIPEVVVYEENGVDAKSVDYPRLVAVLIEAIKEQQVEITELRQSQKELQKLAARVNDLEKKLHRPSLVQK